MTIAIKGSDKRWPSRIPFIHSSNVTDSMKEEIRAAMADYERLTQARFERKNDADTSWIRFRRDDDLKGCGISGKTGKSPGEVLIRLLESCDKGTVLHELGHAIGLHHEHKRPDAEPDNVTINVENIEDDSVNQFLPPKEPDECVIRGDYDYDSIMHYPKDAFSKNGENTIDAPQHIGQRDHLTPRDLFMLHRLMPSNAHVHALKGNGGIGREVTRYDWTEGWTVVRFFRLDFTDYLFTLKTSDGTMHISRMEGDGTVGPRVETRDWRSGWTLVEFYRNGPDTYIFTLKEETGEVDINKMNRDGTIGPLVESHDWGSGWAAACFYYVFPHDFALFFKRNGLVHIHKMDWGKVGEHIATENLPGSSWKTAVHFTQGTNNFIFFLKNSGARVSEITWEGKLGRTIRNYNNWTSGWTHAAIYEKDNWKKYLLTLKSGSGTVDVNPLRDNGTVAPKLEEHEWSSGWTNVAVMDNRYVLFVKETGSAGMI